MKAILMGLATIQGELMAKVQVPPILWIVGVLVLVLYLIFSKSASYYCSDCGNSLGPYPKVCSRCGCNRPTKIDPKRKR